MSSTRRGELEALVDALERGEVTRAQFLRRSAGAGLSFSAASALLASRGLGEALAAPAVKRGGAVTVAVTPPSYPIDPYKSGDPGSRLTFQNVVNYLVFITPDLRLEPELATSWHSKDAKTWTIKLRKGVRFHSGKPFVADDVVSTFRRVVDPKTGSSGVSSFSAFLQKDGITKVDDHTVRFELTRPVSGFPYTLRTYQAAIMPSTFKGSFAKDPDGTGPFKLASYTPKQRAELVRNPHYWEPGAPYLDRVHIVYYEDIGAQVTALQSGDADIMVDVPLDSVPTVKAGGSDIQLLTASSASFGELAMRVDRAPFTDVRVRQALALTLDRKKLVRDLLSGYADLGNDHVIAPVYPIARFVKVPQRTQDYAKAKALLAAAGHQNGVDVTLRTHDIFGLPQFAQALVEMAKPAGIRIALKVEPDDIYYQHWNTAPFSLEAWIHRPWPSQLLNLAYRCGADWNMPHWCDDGFDRLVNRFDAELDKSKQGALANQIARRMHDQTPSVIAYFIKTTKAVRGRVKGQKPEPTDYLDLRRTWIG